MGKALPDIWRSTRPRLAQGRIMCGIALAIKMERLGPVFPPVCVSTYKGSAADFATEGFYRLLKIAFEDPALKNNARTYSCTLGLTMKGYVSAAVNQALRVGLINIEEKPTYEDYCLQVKNIVDRLTEFKLLSAIGTGTNTRGSLAYPDSRSVTRS
ncbi:hypothetical protein V1527DRAFT_334089 [Lipomyces starkeyi]